MSHFRPSKSAWQRAATTSVVWDAIAPARRLWAGAASACARAGAACDSESLSIRRHKEEHTIAIVAASRLVRFADRMLASVIAAWRDSASGGTLHRIVVVVTERSVADRARLAGGVTVVASATALALERLSSRPAPLTWIVPAVFLLAGLCLLAMARERPAR